MADILQALINGMTTFLSSEPGLTLVSLAVIAAVVGFVFSIPARASRYCK